MDTAGKPGKPGEPGKHGVGGTGGAGGAGGAPSGTGGTGGEGGSSGQEPGKREGASTRMRLTIVFGLVLLIVAFGALWYSVGNRGAHVDQARQAAAEACEAANRNLDAVQDVFAIFRAAVEGASDEPRTAEDRQRADEFFAAVHIRLNAARCDTP